MTTFINHRVNSVEQLQGIPRGNGCEVDLRYHEDELILHHDPFGHQRTTPTRFNDFLSACSLQGPLILNIKTEGIEAACIEAMRTHGLTNWFFLDLSMPMAAIFAEKAASGDIEGFGPGNLAVRFSEREPVEYALAYAGKAKWVWVDCFTHQPLTPDLHARLTEAGFRICLVSPELQQHDLSRIAEFRAQLQGLPIHAICTKRPDLWSQGEGAP